MKQQKLWRRLLPLALALFLLLPLTPTVVVPASAKVTQADIDKLKNDASSLASQKELANQLKEIRADKNKAMDQKELIERQIEVIQSVINNINDQIQSYSTLIEEKEVELAENQKQEQAQYELFCKRVREMEEDGEVSYWSVLFSSDDFTDLLDNLMMVEEIIEYDNRVMEDLLAIREKIETDKAELEQAKADRETARQEQQAAKDDLKAQEAEVDKLIGEISASEDLLEAQEAELRKAADALNAEIKRKEQEMAAQISNVPSESGFLWPLSSYNTLSSLYGNRIHPVTHKPGKHSGIDIPAPKGTPILAAKSGVVITSVYGSGSSWSYGNYVVVSHSDGTSTLYAHMSKRSVKEGQTVKQGQKLGEVGTTGRSTGNHLHFEIRLKGTRKDPIDYFKDKTLYVRSGGKKVLLEH